MALAWEHRLARTAVRNRRGVWTTYGGAGSWESMLFQSPDHDPLDLLGQLKDVSTVERDVTQKVYSSDFIEPDGGWMLVVHSKYQDWVWLVGAQPLLRSLMEDAPGRWLRTGDENTSGAIYVEVRENGKRTLYFSSDGAAWDEAEDDEEEVDGFLVFEAKDYDKDWPLEYETLDDVHQQLIIDLDAYVPDCFWNNGLCAMQDDAVKPQHVERMDLITFGGQRKTLSPSHKKKMRQHKVVKASRGEKPKTSRKKKQSTAHFQPTREDIEALPETFVLKPVKKLSWKNNDEYLKFYTAFFGFKFEPIGLFKDEDQNHQLAAFLHEKQKLYGVIEQIGDYIFGYTVLCYSLNRGRRIRCVVSIDDDVLKSDYIEDFIMEPAIASPISSIVSQLFDYDEKMDNKKLAMEIDAESFPELYTQVYRQFRKHFLKTFE